MRWRPQPSLARLNSGGPFHPEFTEGYNEYPPRYTSGEEQNKSLLPGGAAQVRGTFSRLDRGKEEVNKPILAQSGDIPPVFPVTIRDSASEMSRMHQRLPQCTLVDRLRRRAIAS